MQLLSDAGVTAADVHTCDYLEAPVDMLRIIQTCHIQSELFGPRGQGVVLVKLYPVQ